MTRRRTTRASESATDGRRPGQCRRALVLEGTLLQGGAQGGDGGNGDEAVGEDREADVDPDPSRGRGRRKQLLRRLLPDAGEGADEQHVGHHQRRQPPGHPGDQGEHGEHRHAHRDRHPQRRREARLPGPRHLHNGPHQGPGHRHRQHGPVCAVAFSARAQAEHGQRDHGGQRRQAEKQVVDHGNVPIPTRTERRCGPLGAAGRWRSWQAAPGD